MRHEATHGRHAFIALSLCAMTVWLFLPFTAPASAAVAEECWTMDGTENGFLEKLNMARSRHGLRPVTIDPELARVAQHHSVNMKIEQRTYHTPGIRLERRVTNWKTLGETVGRGLSPESLFDAFMASNGHRYVFLNKSFRFVGIGISYDERWIWATFVFEGDSDPGTTMDMAPC